MSTRTSKWLFGLVTAVYLLGFPYHPALRSPNELCRLWQTRAIVEFGELQLNRTLHTYGWVGDLSVKDGRFYPSKAPLLSFAAVPVYAALKAVGGGDRHAVGEVQLVFIARLLFTVLPTLVILFFMRRFLRTYLSEPLTDSLLVTYALGSLALHYSWMFLSHQTTAVLLFASFYCLWRNTQPEPKRVRNTMLGGFFTATAVACEYTSALGAVALSVYLALNVWNASVAGERPKSLARELGLFAAGAAPMLIALMAYHQAIFGHPLESGYKHLVDTAYQPWHVGGFLGIRFPSPTAFAHSFFSPLRGLFTLSPFLMLSAFGFAALRRTDRAMFAFTVLLSVGYIYFTSSFSHESWGWSAAPRHLTGWIPFLLLPIGLALTRLQTQQESWNVRRALLWGSAIGLLLLSMVVTGTVAQVNYVPDSLSTSLFGAALPLLREGYWPASLFTFFGIPHPIAGMPTLILLLVAAGFVVWTLIQLAPRDRRAHVAFAALAVTVLHLGVLRMATRDDAGDLQSREHLRGSWWVKPGETAFFPN